MLDKLSKIGGWVLAGIFMGGTFASAEVREYQDREYHVEWGELKRGKTDGAQILAIHIPDLASPGAMADIPDKLNAIAEVGAQSVAFDLYGFSECGTTISEEALEAFREARHQWDWRRMGAVCRVFADDAPEDFVFRRNAVRTAAQALHDELKAIYWIDGPRANELIAMFKYHAPWLTVAGFDDGDVHLIGPGDAAQPGVPNIYLNWSQPTLDGSAYVVLPAEPLSYQALEQALTMPVEKMAWEPDNSMVSAEERAEGFIALFDGKTLNGWDPLDGAGVFVVQDGAITRVGGRWSQLRTRDRYEDFILRLEWRMEDGGNSGVFIRAPRGSRYSKIGMEFQLMNDGSMEPSTTGLGGIYEAQAPLTVARKPPMEWNTLEITCQGPHLKAVLNGVLVQDINLDEHEELQHRLRRGFIALQDHGNYVQFRNIRIKPL